MHGHSECCSTFSNVGRSNLFIKLYTRELMQTGCVSDSVKTGVNFCDTTGSKNVLHLTLVQQIVGCRIITHLSFKQTYAIITRIGYVQLKCIQLYI